MTNEANEWIPVTIPFTNVTFNVTEVIITSWIVMAVIILWAFLATRKMKLVPAGLQNSAEIVVEVISNFVKGIMGEHHYKAFVPYIGALGLYLALSNTIGALFFMKPPTRDFSVAITLAIMTIVLVLGAGIKARGIKGWVKSLFKPIWVMFPFNLLEYIIKPLSLSMRLFGNIYGAYILMHMFLQFAISESAHITLPIVPAIACLYFDLFDGGLQAFVFVLLTTLYIAEAIEVEE